MGIMHPTEVMKNIVPVIMAVRGAAAVPAAGSTSHLPWAAFPFCRVS
jgi:hypothetical protein